MRDDGEHYKAAYKRPCGLFKEGVGLADAHYRACRAELRREASAFGFLDKDNAYEQNGYNNCQYNYDNVHIDINFLSRRVTAKPLCGVGL